MIYIILKNVHYILNKIYLKYWNYYNNSLLKYFFKGVNKVQFRGKTLIRIGKNSKLSLGKNIVINSGSTVCINSCNISKLTIYDNAILIIGNNVGISAAAITAANKIIIEDNVNIGSGTIILDTNFHSTNFRLRADRSLDGKNVKTAPIIIGKNVFIGANCMIMKGVSIGENSIVAAGSVVIKSIPENQIWGGNPAKFIKNL